MNSRTLVFTSADVMSPMAGHITRFLAQEIFQLLRSLWNNLKNFSGNLVLHRKFRENVNLVDLLLFVST